MSTSNTEEQVDVNAQNTFYSHTLPTLTEKECQACWYSPLDCQQLKSDTRSVASRVVRYRAARCHRALSAQDVGGGDNSRNDDGLDHHLGSLNRLALVYKPC